MSAVLEGLAREALRGEGAAPITASEVATFAQSPWTAWCLHHAPPEEKDALGAFQKMLFEQGREHEARVVAARFPDALATSYETEEEGFRLALDAMARGVRLIHGAPLFWLPEGLQGRADVLERRDDAPSRWGAWHYVVKEVKLAKNVKDHHRLQGAFYNHILGRIQGYAPPAFHVVNRDHEETAFPYSEPELAATLHAIRAIRAGTLTPEPAYDGGLWPWESYTNRRALERDDVSLVNGVGGATREKLVAAGFSIVARLAAARPEALTAIKGIKEKTATKLLRCAEAMATKRHVRIGDATFPDGPEIFLDLEGTGAQTSGEGLVEMDYLIGAILRRGGVETYVPFVARTLDGEAAMFHAWLATQREGVVYHWTHYEPTHLRKLAERHGADGHDLDALLFGRMRDLAKDATNAFAYPTPSTSIKALAPYMGFSWRHKDVNAMESIALYFAFLAEGDEEKLQKVLDYNEDDCIAMRVVRDWLAANAAP